MTFELQDVSVTYRSAQVLQALSNTIDGSAVTVVQGQNGAGKSTLLRLLHADLLPTHGSVKVNATSTQSMKARQRRAHKQQVAFVHQQPSLLPIHTVYHNVLMVFAMRGIKKVEANKQALELIAELGLSHCKHLLPTQISSGERQVVALARALAMEPVTLLADELTSMADADTTSRIATVLNTRIGRGLGLILTTHREGLARLLPVTIHLTLRDGSLFQHSTNNQ